MMLEELNIVAEDKSPLKSGLATLVAFVAAGLVPLVVYVTTFLVPAISVDSFIVSTTLTAIVLFAVGSLRTAVTGRRWWVSGFEMTAVGGLAALAAYLIGYLLRGIVP